MSVLRIDTASEIPVYVQIMDRVRSGIRKGALKGGAPLPSVRQLASDLGVNPNTVAKAYMLLEREGVLTSVGRRGTFVSSAAIDRVRRTGEEKLGDSLDRVLEEMDRLGIDRASLLQAVRRKLGGKGPDRSSGGDV